MKKILVIFVLLHGLVVWTVSGMDNPHVVIAEIMYDSPLNEQIATGVAYSNGEYVQLCNLGRQAVDLTGWTLTGGGSTEKFVLPGITLPANAFLIVAYQYNNSNFVMSDLYAGVTGNGSDKQIVYQRKILLSNSGETISLIDPLGTIADRITYDGTSNKTKPNRLAAENADLTPGLDCVSLQRVKAVFDESGNAVPDNTHWTTARVSPFSHRIAWDDQELILGDNNYIHTRSYVKEQGAGYFDRVDYYNGLGYLEQTVDCAAAPSGKDLVSLHEYNTAMLKSKDWLPIPMADNHGAYNWTETIRGSSDCYDDSAPYLEIRYEDFASGRVERQYNAGEAFHWWGKEKFVETKYTHNRTDSVAILSVNDRKLEKHDYYYEGALEKTVRKNEDGTVTHLFEDNFGRKILERIVDGTSNIDTYFVYDDFGRLALVITPEGTARFMAGAAKYDFTSDLIKDYCYYYRYDERGNMIQRHQPGLGVEYMKYDNADRLVKYCNGKAVIPKSSPQGYDRCVWISYVYDAFNRIVKQNQSLELIDEPSAVLGPRTQSEYWYSGVWYVVDSKYPDVQRLRTIPEHLGFVPIEGVVANSDLGENTGMKIYEKLAEIDSAYMTKSAGFLERGFYYDKKGRVVQTVTKTPLGGICRYSNKYDFVGNVLAEVEQVQPKSGDAVIEKKTLRTYDQRGRLLTEITYMNGGQVASMGYSYDEFGRQQTVAFGQDDARVVDSMRYSVQGWLTSQKYTRGEEEIFRSELRYFDPRYAATTASYTGNISEWTWQHGEQADETTYAFAYDRLSRLTDPTQYISGQPDNRYVETGLTYDRNGNILTLERYENGVLRDNYAYFYTGNQLQQILIPGEIHPKATALSLGFRPQPVEASGFIDFEPIDPQRPVIPIDSFDPEEPGVLPGEHYDPNKPIFWPDSLVIGGDGNITKLPFDDPLKYTYDTTGNMIHDPITGFTIRYNHMNRIEKILHGDTLLVKYSYLSDGSKLSVTDSLGDGFYYLGSLVYRKQGDSFTPESIGFSGGRIVATSTDDGLSFTPGYFITDHLGSVRAVVNATGEITERNDYYPLGGRWSGEALQASTNRYLFNGKEKQVLGNIGYLDYGARMYDPHIGRWGGSDPLAWKYYPVSPYAFCLNNPVGNVDPDGATVKDAIVGVLYGVVSNLTGNVSLREKYTPQDADDYNNALRATDAATMAIGAGMIFGGGEAAAAGGAVLATSSAVTLATVGLSVEITGPTAVGGAALVAGGTVSVAGGTMLMMNTGKNAQQGYDYGEGNKHINPKKEAREQAKVKREEQPASESYAKYKAKQLENASGKDARRKAHDEKDKVGKDRTKLELDEDYIP